MKKHLSRSQRIHNALASQAVENTKAAHSYFHARADSATEWSTIWSRDPDCSWAHLFGRWRGFKSVWYGSVGNYDAQAFRNALNLWEKYPEIGGKDPRPIMECSIHTLVTEVIEVADDGKTARSSFMTPGLMHSTLDDTGRRRSNILWERYGSDFIYEDGEWKYLHENVLPDIFGCLDYTNWAALDYSIMSKKTEQKDEEPVNPDDRSAVSSEDLTKGMMLVAPPCEDPGPLHLPYNPCMRVQDTCPCPKPYATMDEFNTYSPPKREDKEAE